jgi:hypothetical protein
MADITPLAEKAASAVVSGGDPRVGLRPLLVAMQRDPSAYPATRHILGFLHCKVADVNGHTLRIHIWTEGKRRIGYPNWPMHTHHWTISSAILAGFVLNDTFAVAEEDDGPYRLYEVGYLSHNLSERRRTEARVASTPIRADRWYAGERYEIPLGAYHSTTVPAGAFAATAILTGLRTPSSPLVVGEASGKDRYRYAVDPAPCEEWLGALTQLLELMKLP